MNLFVGTSKLSMQSTANLNALSLHPVLLVVLVTMDADVVVDPGILMLKTGLGPATTVVIGMVIKLIVRNTMDTVHLDMTIVMIIVHSNLEIKVDAGAGMDTLGIAEPLPTWPLMMKMMIMTLHMHLC